MNRELGPGSGPEPGNVLQDQFRLGELDRTISSRRFLLTTVRWLYIPVLVMALVLMVVGLVLGWGSFGPVLGGAMALFAAVLSLVHKAGEIRDDLVELQDERDSMAGAVQARSRDMLSR
jgi:hypothetical protein